MPPLRLPSDIIAAERPRQRVADSVVLAVTGAIIAASVGFFCVVMAIAARNPGYFDRLLIATMNRDVDPIETGATEKDAGSGVPAIPVPKVVRKSELTPRDFQIVMVFGEEAHLSSPGELWRVRAGTLVPGLGEILSIEPGRNGGTVRAQNATLTGVLKSH